MSIRRGMTALARIGVCMLFVVTLLAQQVFAVESAPLHGLQDPEFKGLSGEQIRTALRGPYPERRPKPHVPFHAKPMHPGRSAAIEYRRIPVELVEESGLDRTAEPVRFGFPLPEGVLFDPPQIRMVSPTGDECPAQFTITGFWKDGSIRWLLVTFMADVKANGKVVYAVEFGSKVRCSPILKPVLFRQTGDAILVDTGPMRVQLNGKSFSLFDKVWLDANSDGRFAPEELIIRSAPGGIIMTDRDGERYSAGPVEFRIEEQGPLTMSLRFEGSYASSSGKQYFRHITRLRFFAGSTIIGIAHSHVDDYLEHEFADFAAVRMPLEIEGRNPNEARFLFRGLGDRFIWRGSPLSPDGGLRLFQRDDAHFTLTGGGLDIRGQRAPGVVELLGPEGTLVSAAVEDFWQNYPGAIQANNDGLTIELWPEIQDGTEYEALPEYLRFPFVGGCYRFKWGMSKTHHLWLAFGPQSIAGLGTAGLAPVVPASWYEETGGLGPMVAKRPGEFEAWDEAFEKCFESHMQRKEAFREYGFFNWGDWYGERSINWGNNEYDLPHGLFMQFARTGDRRYFRLALAGARHQADVDMVHAYPDSAVVGGNMLHSVCHTGEWSEKIADRGWSTAYTWQAMASNGHTWADGMCDAWYLAGDSRVMEAAQGLGEHIVYGMAPRFTALGTHERSAGWSLQAALALYRATLDPLYLDAARKIAEVAFKEQKLDGNGIWPHPLPEGHCGHSTIPGASICVGNSPFLIAILCSGLKEYHLVSGDQRAKRSLIAASPWWKEMWNPEVDSFPYTSCSLMRSTASPLYGAMCADAVMYGYQLTGDVEYLNMAARGFVASLAAPPGGLGKSFAQLAQHASRVMAALRKHQDRSPEARRAIRMTSRDILQERMSAGGPAPSFGVRSPELKRFFVLNPGTRSRTIRIERQPYGARPKEKPTGSVTVTSLRGALVKYAEFSTDLPYQLDVELPASSDNLPYRVEISDDMRGIWNVGGEANVVLECRSGTSLANLKFHRLYFFVPSGTESFRLQLDAIHEGPFAATVFDASNDIRASVSGNKLSREIRSGSRTVSVTVPQGKGGKVWSVVILAGGDVTLRMEGVPPYLSRTPEGWFDPEARD